MALSSTDDSSIPQAQTYIHCIFKTPRNAFGLFRQYYSEILPSHDPEDLLTLSDMSLLPLSSQSSNAVILNSKSTTLLTLPAYYPYPNETSFHLGSWFWNGGLQKSQDSFKELLNIIGHPSFDPANLRHTKWDNINSSLASEYPREEEWMDKDAGWSR